MHPEILEHLKINTIPYKVIHCLIREPAGVVNQGDIAATRYRGVYEVKDLNNKTFFAIIDDYKTEFSTVAHPISLAKNLLDLF